MNILQSIRQVVWIGSILFLFIGCSRNRSSTSEPISITRVVNTAVPTPTSASSPTITATPTAALQQFASSTPLMATPLSSGIESYRLKAMSVTEAQTVFEEMYNRILADVQSGDLVQVANVFGEELLLRYPELHQNTEFLLYLAYLQTRISLSPNGYSATAFYEALEVALNTNRVQPSQLDSWLEPYRFVIADQLEATNLFGDGQPTKVLHIEAVLHTETMTLPTDDVVVVISGESPGEYHLTPLRDTWLEYNLTSGGGGETITVADRNGNSRPDVASIINVYGHASCSSDLGLYEWRGDKESGSFANIAPIPELWSIYAGYSCPDVWHFSQPDADGKQSVIRQINNYSVEGCTGFQFQQIYSWNGIEYTFTEDSHIAYDESQSDKCRVGWAYYAPAELAIPVFEPVRDHWLPEYNSWGAASQDLLLFKSGVWYAFAGQQAAAKMVMEELATNPPTPQYTLIPRLATAFLSVYQSQADAYAACAAVIQTAQADLDAHPRSSDYIGMETDRLEALWGIFDRSWQIFPFLDVLCDRSEAFDISISELNITSTEELETWSAEHQLPLLVLASQDFSKDGEADWLVVVMEKVLGNFYLFIKGVDGIVTIPITAANLAEMPTPSHFESFNLNSGTAYLVQVDDVLVVFQMDALQANVLLSTWGVANYTLLSHLEAQIMITRTTGTQEVYTWNDQSKIFEAPPYTSPEYEQAKAVREIQHTLLDLGDAQTAVTLLETLLSGEIIEQNPDYGYLPVKPRLLYLLGLAYELTNRETDALQTYWQLWQDYPDNSYTQLAKSKLEPITP